MRMRKKKNLLPRMERCGRYLITEPTSLRGNWRQTLLPAARELRLELGCGKGRFTAETALSEPDILFVAIERVADAMVVAMERCADMGLENVFFLDADASHLSEFFSPEEVARIYVNFCDPWPGNRHAKRRLTHGNFLKLYRQVLSPGGQLYFKSDNAPLFEFSVEEIPQFGFALSELTRNLHQNGPCGVMTDYEQKFHEMGTCINRCVGTMVPWTEAKRPEYEEFRSRFLSTFAAQVPADALETHVLSEGNRLWHLFSRKLVVCLEGEPAQTSFDSQDYQTAFFFYNGDWGDAPYVKEISKIPSSLLDTKDDLFVVAEDFSWVYVHTHEETCGPYFCQKK